MYGAQNEGGFLRLARIAESRATAAPLASTPVASPRVTRGAGQPGEPAEPPFPVIAARCGCPADTAPAACSQ